MARLRKQVEPVEPQVFTRLLTHWQGLARRRPGLDALLDAIEHLQGAPMPATIFESEMLANRVEGYNPSDLDALARPARSSGRGVEPIGDRDGRLALYLTDHLSRLRVMPASVDLDTREKAIVAHLESEGASFFAAVLEAAGGGYPAKPSTRSGTWSGKGSLQTTRSMPCAPTLAHPNARARRSLLGARSAADEWRRLPPKGAGRWSHNAS